MKVDEDFSLVNRNFVERGLSQEFPYQLILQRFFTEEERAENAAAYVRLSKDEWNARCKDVSEGIGKEVVGILEMLRKHFKIGQYDPDDTSVTYENCDLLFWCNDTDGARDYSYVTLEPPMDEQRPEDCRRVFEEIRKLLEAYDDTKNVSATIRFCSRLNEEAVEQEAARIFSKAHKKIVQYQIWVGKIFYVKTQDYTGYAFRKKGCQKLYKMSAADVCGVELLEKRTSPSSAQQQKMEI